MIRLLIFAVGVLLASALAGACFAIADGRRGRHVAPLPRLPYIGRFRSRRVTVYIGQPYPDWVCDDEATLFAAIAANNPDLNTVVDVCADLYLIPEDTR